MATRILITDTDGRPLFGLDGHHGSAHAARWVQDTLAMLEADGVAAMAVEFEPAEGGTACRRDVIGQIHRVRLELRTLQAGGREIAGVLRYREAAPGEEPRPEYRGLTAGQAASTPEPVHATLRVLHAPPDIANARAFVRVGRGRLNPPDGQLPSTPQEQRHARRLAAAKARP